MELLILDVIHVIILCKDLDGGSVILVQVMKNHDQINVLTMQFSDLQSVTDGLHGTSCRFVLAQCST